ncbi:MAG TPA: hypothetical protein VGK73_29310 [Polyangiaceae bacterium]
MLDRVTRASALACLTIDDERAPREAGEEDGTTQRKDQGPQHGSADCNQRATESGPRRAYGSRAITGKRGPRGKVCGNAGTLKVLQRAADSRRQSQRWM